VKEGAVVRALAPAKVNLSLEVLGRRADGYHELVTLMAALELADELEVRARSEPGIALAVVGPCASADVPRDARNLAWRAAAAVLERRRGGGRPGVRGVELVLSKRLPSGAGLGGGSADAAAAVVAVERALGLPPDPAWRREVLAGLGADCVFFHDVEASGLARCEGIGERVTPVGESPPSWVLLCLTPAVHCPTAEVYAALGERRRALRTGWRWGAEPARLTVREARERLSTDLEAAALAVLPELRRWRELLDEEGGDHLRLCGSGSSFFGLFEGVGEAEVALERFLHGAARQGLGVRFRGVTRIRSGGVVLRIEG